MTRAEARERWTVSDLEALPDDEWRRYEIVDGELFVSRAPGDDHAEVQAQAITAVGAWNNETGLGRVLVGPGIIFGEYDAVIPDFVWVSHERSAAIMGEDKHLHGAPELVVEVLSPGPSNERRDRQAKLKQYSVYGVPEYWIVDPRTESVAVYRRQRAQLRLVATLGRDDTLTSPLLPGFSLAVGRLFPRR
ncbi:MAG TPA: Uma2 family endonuclease [Chloroflexota bacterium]|nr:Uma2 family endonuclease [Chloroflexota bacterium]